MDIPWPSKEGTLDSMPIPSSFSSNQYYLVWSTLWPQQQLSQMKSQREMGHLLIRHSSKNPIWHSSTHHWLLQ